MRHTMERFPMKREQWGVTPWNDFGFPAAASLFSASPWQVMRRLQEDMDRLFNEVTGIQTQQLGAGQQPWQPRLDISETDGEWLIEADLPGVDKENIDVQVQNGHLILRAEMRREQEVRPEEEGKQDQQRRYYRRERQYGYFERVLALPDSADDERIRCEFKDGVLTVHLPKLEQGARQGRRIPIGDAAQGPQTGTAGLAHGQQAHAGAAHAGDGQHGYGGQEKKEPALAGVKGGEASSSKPSHKKDGSGKESQSK